MLSVFRSSGSQWPVSRLLTERSWQAPRMGSPRRLRVMSQIASKSPLMNSTGWRRPPPWGAARAYAMLALSFKYQALAGRNPWTRNASTRASKSAGGQSAGSGAVGGAR